MDRHSTFRSSPRGRAVLAGLFVASWAAAFAAGRAGAEDAVVVNITGPLKGVLGQKVAYDVELINNSGRNLEKLRITDYFDEGFHHVASTSPIEFKETIDLPAGTKRWVKLEFELDGVGRQCHRVEILDQAKNFMGGATECCLVQAPAQPPAATTPPPTTPPATATTVPPVLVPPPTTVTAPASTVIPTAPPAATAQPRLELAGPTDAMSGTPGTYKATIRNLGAAATTPGTLKISWDNGLVPQQASEGFSIAGSSVSWNVPGIPAGGSAERDIVLQAETPPTVYSDSAPITARVNAEWTLATGIAAADLRSVAIRSTTPRPRPRSIADSGLRLSLADLDDPVRAGDATTLVCTIVNTGTMPSGPLDVVVDLPRGARPVGNYRARVENGRVLFDPLDVPPGGQKMVEISYMVGDAGRYTASANATSSTLTGSLGRDCETEFLPR